MDAVFPNRVEVVPRMSRKADGINAARGIFPLCWFDIDKCREGIQALRNYKYDVDEDTRSYSKEPLHDENSDAADAFAQMALSLQESKPAKVYHESSYASSSPNAWMAR